MILSLWHLYNRQLDLWLIWGWIWAPIWVPAIWSGLAARAIWIVWKGKQG